MSYIVSSILTYINMSGDSGALQGIKGNAVRDGSGPATVFDDNGCSLEGHCPV